MQIESTAVTATEATRVDQHPVAGLPRRRPGPSALKQVTTVQGILKVCWRLGLMDTGGRSAGKENTANGKGKGIIYLT